MEIRVVLGDIIAQRLGAVGTAANESLPDGGGMYGCSPKQAARVAVDTLRAISTRGRKVALVAFDEGTRRLLSDAAAT